MSKVDWLNRSLITGPHYCLALSEKQFHKALNNLGWPKTDRPEWLINGANGTTHHLQSDSGEMASIVCVELGDATDLQIIGLLAHESVHIWQRFCEAIGEKSPGREMEAYSIQAISQNLIMSYREQTGR